VLESKTKQKRDTNQHKLELALHKQFFGGIAVQTQGLLGRHYTT
jgi:hypothetical protein